MALEQKLNWGGVKLPKVYIRVHSIFGSKMGWNSVVRIYSDKKSANEKPEVFIKELNFFVDYDPKNINPFNLIYTAIKSSSDFNSPVDDADEIVNKN